MAPTAEPEYEAGRARSAPHWRESQDRLPDWYTENQAFRTPTPSRAPTQQALKLLGPLHIKVFGPLRAPYRWEGQDRLPYWYHPGGNPGATLKSISNRCYLREVAFEWQLTKGTIYLPLGCLQGGTENQNQESFQDPYTSTPLLIPKLSTLKHQT